MNNLFWKVLGYDIYKSRNHLDGLKKLSKIEFWNQQEKDRDSILKYHLDNNAWYKKLITGNRSGWDSIPVLSKSDLQDFSLKNYPQKKTNLSHSNLDS